MVLPHSPEQSPSLGQHQSCFEGCRTPAGSEADDAGSQNNQNNSKKKGIVAFPALCWHWGGWGLAEGTVAGICPLLLSSVPWEHHCPEEVFGALAAAQVWIVPGWEMPQARCPGTELCLCLSSPRALAGFGLQGPSTITSCTRSQQAPDGAGTDTLVCSCLPCRCALRARPPELRLLPDAAAAGQVPPPHRARPVLPQLPPARAAGSAPRPPAPLPEVTALSPRPAPCWAGLVAVPRPGGLQALKLCS